MIFNFGINKDYMNGLFYLMPVILIDYYVRTSERNLIFSKNSLINNSIFMIISIVIFFFFLKENQVGFIYFQF